MKENTYIIGYIVLMSFSFIVGTIYVASGSNVKRAIDRLWRKRKFIAMRIRRQPYPFVVTPCVRYVSLWPRHSGNRTAALFQWINGCTVLGINKI